MEVEADARRARKATEAAFLDLLKSAAPPVTHGCTFEDTAARLGGEARWGAIGEEGRRRELFEAYVAAALQVRGCVVFVFLWAGGWAARRVGRSGGRAARRRLRSCFSASQLMCAIF